jgi:hypothetical protein
MKHLTTLLLALFLASASWSQEAEEPESASAEANDTTEATDPAVDEDESELDEPGYGGEEEEDDFVPSKEVTADQSLAFPVDI